MVIEIKRRFRFRAVGFRFDAMAAWLMCQQHGVDLDSMDKIPKEEYVSSWIWSAHRSFCMMRYRQPMAYEKMKQFIARMRKWEWDRLITEMTTVKTSETEDKKKEQPGEDSLSTDGKQE